MIPNRISIAAATAAATLIAGMVPVLAAPGPSQMPAHTVSADTCLRDLEGVGWFFDPCVPEGYPLPPDVITGMEEDRRARECASLTPSASAQGRIAVTSMPTETAAPPSEPPSPSPTPCPSPTSPEPTPTFPDPDPTPTFPEPTPTFPSPDPTPTTPSPTFPPPTFPPTFPPPTFPPPTFPTPSPSSSGPVCTAPAAVNDDAAKRREADKDKICPPNRNPQRPIVLAATGDSVTSAHIQIKHYHEPKKCAVNGNTLADHRNLPGNDMTNSYAGRYVTNHNPDVVEYYNFARTGMGTQEILGAAATYKDACENAWARAFPPIQLAEAVVAKAKADGKRAYYVTTGGVNNTNWTQVASGVGMCGMASFLRVEMVRYFIRNNLPFNVVIRYYDPRGREIGKDDLIKGGACQVVLQENLRGNEVTINRLRFNVPVYDGPAQYAGITRDVGAITGRMINAGADKIVWMGYYDITPAKIKVGKFADQYVQNTDLPAVVKGALPNIPDVELDLISTQAWKDQAKTWTNELNKAIKDAILANDPLVRFQPAPALTADKIQKTMIGGCPHPNFPGHDDLTKSLDTAFKALPGGN